jgi:hypothetical protein
MNDYTTIFDKLLDIINYKTLEISAYKLNIDYNIALNHLKALIYFHLAKLDSLRDIDDFMQSDSKLKESIGSVSLGTLSNYMSVGAGFHPRPNIWTTTPKPTNMQLNIILKLPNLRIR